MSTIPRAVLSEHLQNYINGRKINAAVFTTYQFDPGFFEDEILPVFFDVPFSHVPAVRRVQLEEPLQLVKGGVAVYYDQDGLAPESGSAKLHLQRIAVRRPHGVFHPKNVFVLVENAPSDPDEPPSQALMVACMSANLTRSGWWENVEVCHVEEVHQGHATRMHDSLLATFDELVAISAKRLSQGHAALESIRRFVAEQTRPRKKRRGGKDHRLLPHFYSSAQGSVVQFIQDSFRYSLEGWNLEVISPYFGPGTRSLPLIDLVQRFHPKSLQIYLPRNEKGEALCSRDFFDSIHDLDVRHAAWGQLPKSLRRRGGQKDVAERFVHAKVYRFFSPSTKQEILFVGSVNLTNAAHSGQANFETGFLVEVAHDKRPAWWLEVDDVPPKAFHESAEDEARRKSIATHLALKYSWRSEQAAAYWDDAHSSPALSVFHQDQSLFDLDNLAPRRWIPIADTAAKVLQRILKSTSILNVQAGDEEPAPLLVQEDDMDQKPSLFGELTPQQIYEYWSLLTPEQKAAALNSGLFLQLTADDSALVVPLAKQEYRETLFDRFAGIFHAFGCLENEIKKALDDANTKRIRYLVFGLKYDSLASLIDKILDLDQKDEGDPIEHYVGLLCAQQLVQECQKHHVSFWQNHSDDVQRLHLRLAAVNQLRDRLLGRNSQDPEMVKFLDWFESWFVQRAQAVVEDGS
ncbi:MAG: hypothetical protein H6684_09385 [Deltaproteobacteria bacterium]|nr:hypothetical protein [Deltaproteobacteria bacterium]MCB9488928.1 hypothetical protein [Deltaproteobacteria bacterium]